MNRRTTRRRGAALIFVMVAVAVAGGILAVLVEGLVVGLRQSEHLDARAQADLTAARLLDDAERRLADDPDYAGGAAEITPADWIHDYAARAEVVVEAGRISVTVVCPADRVPFHTVTRTRPSPRAEDPS